MIVHMSVAELTAVEQVLREHGTYLTTVVLANVQRALKRTEGKRRINVWRIHTEPHGTSYFAPFPHRVFRKVYRRANGKEVIKLSLRSNYRSKAYELDGPNEIFFTDW